MATKIGEPGSKAALPGPSKEIPEEGWVWFDGSIVPFADAKVSIATNALQYGTAVFEGIRAYWNPAHEELYVFRLREHFARMGRSVRILRGSLPGDSARLSAMTVELLRKNAFRSDVYVRPLAYKAARSVKVALRDLRDSFAMYAFAMGGYLATGGLAAQTASWRRISDDAIPARGKLTGAYLNTALAVDEAQDHGAAEAIFLTREGHVSEGGGANIFMVRDGVLVTPPSTADILEGITRDTIAVIAAELGFAMVEREIDRTELYVCEEIFFCGTGAQVAPCVRVDGRPVGDGAIGPVSRAISERYMALARGDDPGHPEWRTAVYGS